MQLGVLGYHLGKLLLVGRVYSGGQRIQTQWLSKPEYIPHRHKEVKGALVALKASYPIGWLGQWDFLRNLKKPGKFP